MISPARGPIATAKNTSSVEYTMINSDVAKESDRRHDRDVTYLYIVRNTKTS